MRFRFAGLSLAGAFLPGFLALAHAASGPMAQAPVAFGGGSSQLTIAATSLSVAPIRLEDITDKAVQPLAGGQRHTLAIGGQLVAAGAINVPPVRLTVTRELHQVWRMQQSTGRSLADVAVSARIESMAGPGSLASDEQPGSSLPVRIVSQPPRIVATDSHTQTVEGDIVLEFDLRSLRAGGHYSGRLIISAEGT